MHSGIQYKQWFDNELDLAFSSNTSIYSWIQCTYCIHTNACCMHKQQTNIPFQSAFNAFTQIQISTTNAQWSDSTIQIYCTRQWLGKGVESCVVGHVAWSKDEPRLFLMQLGDSRFQGLVVGGVPTYVASATRPSPMPVHGLTTKKNMYENLMNTLKFTLKTCKSYLELKSSFPKRVKSTFDEKWVFSIIVQNYRRASYRDIFVKFRSR